MTPGVGQKTVTDGAARIIDETDSDPPTTESKKHDLQEGKKSVEPWLELVERTDGEVCLRFKSAEGHHFVIYQDGKFVAVYGGPHGVENRPAPIRRAAIEELFRELPVTMCVTRDTKIMNSAVSDLIKIES
jgi:hypothetical protein